MGKGELRSITPDLDIQKMANKERERAEGTNREIQNIETLIYFHHLGNFLISILFPFLISK